MDEENRRESLRLWDVMERVGVTERMRQLHRDTRICMEIIESVTSTMVGVNSSRYHFGSSSEGTTTPGMGSDLDMVVCSDGHLVIDSIEQAVPGRCFLIQADEHTKPGYVKLQEVRDGTPLTDHNYYISDSSDLLTYDSSGRVCLKPYTGVGKVEGLTERSGPADTRSNQPGCIDQDQVPSLRSTTFPRAARESLLECTKSGWLTRDDVEQMMSLGCLFVGVGHPVSNEKDIEWRVSFSLQERQMMFSLNPTQHTCYVLMKLIKELLASQLDGEKSVTSYHCKTCLFRSIIKIGLEPWKPENLIHCILVCLDELLQCVCNNDCPNFFIKANNMFEHRFCVEVRERLIHYIREMLKEGFRVFYRIQSDNIGQALMGGCVNMACDLGIQKYNIYWNMFRTIVDCQVDVYRHLNAYSNNDATWYLVQQMRYLSLKDTISGHTYEETKMAVAWLMPVLHKLHAQHLASMDFETEISESRHHLQISDQYSNIGMTWDLMSGRLVHASILYRQGNIESCRKVLQQIDHTLNDAVILACECYEYKKLANEDLKTRIESSNSDPQSIMKEYVAACTVFLRSHSQIVPTALQYEMYRSVGTQPGSRDGFAFFCDHWFEWGAVDSMVYLYFLEYLVYSALKRGPTAQVAINNLGRVLIKNENLGHRETGYNLLGWVYIQEGRIPEALECFIRSWRIRPDHNAAKWHVLLLYHRLATQQ